jgi:anti-sigma B factor antagonist
LILALTIEQREKEGILILDLKGRLSFGEDDLSFREKLDSLLTSGRKQVILNFQNVDHIDSSGLGTLVTFSGRFQVAGGKLVLLYLNPPQMEVLLLGKLEALFEVFDDEQEAVNSFFPGRTIRHFDVLSFVKQQKEEQS